MDLKNTTKLKPMINPLLLITSVFSCLAVYLFVTAPPQLPEASTTSVDARPIDVANMFNAMNAISDVTRRIYTSRIVGAGKEAGLAFGEDWAEPTIDKGPLPALFARMIAARMETKPAPLGLYLGSDEPINKSNLFTGAQADGFTQLKLNQSQLFLTSAEAGFVAMYPDIASAKPCVTCHNEHPDSPKTDWKMNDVMGATTWTYPNKLLGSAEYLDITDAFYAAIQEAYQIYLIKTAEFNTPITITDEWPEKGKLTLPNSATFMAAIKAESAATVLKHLVLNPSASFDNSTSLRP